MQPVTTIAANDRRFFAIAEGFHVNVTMLRRSRPPLAQAPADYEDRLAQPCRHGNSNIAATFHWVDPAAQGLWYSSTAYTSYPAYHGSIAQQQAMPGEVCGKSYRSGLPTLPEPTRARPPTGYVPSRQYCPLEQFQIA